LRQAEFRDSQEVAPTAKLVVQVPSRLQLFQRTTARVQSLQGSPTNPESVEPWAATREWSGVLLPCQSLHPNPASGRVDGRSLLPLSRMGASARLGRWSLGEAQSLLISFTASATFRVSSDTCFYLDHMHQGAVENPSRKRLRMCIMFRRKLRLLDFPLDSTENYGQPWGTASVR
jgi:hypothetical protein